MIIKYKCNLVCGIGAILASAALFVIIPWQIQVETVVNFGITSRSLPYGIAVLIGVCGMALVTQSLILKQDKEKYWIFPLNYHQRCYLWRLFCISSHLKKIGWSVRRCWPA